MGGISLEDFTQSVAVRSLPPRGHQEGGQGQGLGAGFWTGFLHGAGPGDS